MRDRCRRRAPEVPPAGPVSDEQPPGALQWFFLLIDVKRWMRSAGIRSNWGCHLFFVSDQCLPYHAPAPVEPMPHFPRCMADLRPAQTRLNDTHHMV